MAEMGCYCKAFPIERLREYPRWTENTTNLRRDKQIVDGKEVEVAHELTEDSFLYVQENLTVTDGIFIDENIIFEDTTPEWKVFCAEVLQFSIPEYARPAAEMQTA